VAEHRDCQLSGDHHELNASPHRGTNDFFDRDGGDLSGYNSSAGDYPVVAAYGEQEYWDARYTEETKAGLSSKHYDWYFGYETPALRDLLRSLIPRSADILQLGVGTSTLQVEMVADGYSSIVNTDCSAIVVAHMAEVYADMPELSYVVADCRDMAQFSGQQFDAVLDKGTLDALMCSDTSDHDVRAMLSEVSRVLCPGGVFVEMTYGPPARRMPYLQLPHLSWSVTALAVRQLAPAQPKPPPAEGGEEATDVPQAGGGPVQDDCPPIQRLSLDLPDTLGPFNEDDTRLDSLNGTEVDEYYFVYVCTKHAADGSRDGAANSNME